jgi:hypothetical protein
VTVLVALAVLSFVGAALVLNLPSKQRAVLLPAVPVIGAVVLVALLHLTSLALAVKAGIWVALTLAAAALVAAAVRNRSWRFVPARSVAAFAAVLVVGAVGAAITLVPSMLAQTASVVQPTASNDAFYYVSVANWVMENPLTRLPEIGLSPSGGADSPAYGPALESLDIGLRVGQELLNAGISAVMGVSPVATMSPMLGLYVLLIPGGAWVLGAAFRLPGIARLLLGGLLVTSFSLVDQSLKQNSDSILGIALLPLVLGLCSLVLFRRPDVPRAAPVWLAAVALAALVGTYTEYVPFLFATLGAIALVGPLRGLKTRVLRALSVLGVSVLVGPVIWFRAVQGLLLAASLATRPDTAVPTPRQIVWSFAGPYQGLLRGFEPLLGGRWVMAAVLALLVATAVGLVLALVAARTRGFAVGAAVTALGAVYIAYRGNPYISGRAVDMVTPLLIMAAVLGWSAVGGRVIAVSPRPLAVAFAGLLVAAGIGGTLVGGKVAVDNSALKADDDRIVSDEFAEAARWVDDLGAAEGADVAVAVGTEFDQLWLSDALATESDVSYISLRGDLGYRSDLQLLDYWDGSPDRYVLVGPGAYAAYSPDAVVHSNARFTLLDLERDATVAVPVADPPLTPAQAAAGETGDWSWVVDADGVITSAKSAQIQLLTSRTDLAGLVLTLTSSDDGAVLRLGGSSTDVTVSGGRAALPLDGVAVVDGLAEVEVETSPASAGFGLVGLALR